MVCFLGFCLFVYSGPLILRTKFSISTKRGLVILIDVALNLQIAVASTDILTILSLLIHEYSISFLLFRSSLISFSYVLYFSLYVFNNQKGRMKRLRHPTHPRILQLRSRSVRVATVFLCLFLLYQ